MLQVHNLTGALFLNRPVSRGASCISTYELTVHNPVDRKMSFQLKPDEPLKLGFVRITEEQIDRSLAEVNDTERSQKERIHQARIRCKKIRALLRLVRAFGESEYDHENTWMRACARPLSEMRDIEVLLETFDLLFENGEKKREKSSRAVRTWLDVYVKKTTPSSKKIEEALNLFGEQMRRARGRMEKFPIENHLFPSFAAGFTRTYRQARHAFESAYSSGDGSSFHEWRKQVKYHYHQVTLFRKAWPPVMNKVKGQLSKLDDILGSAHDLAVLRELLHKKAKRAVGAEALKKIDDLIQTRREQLKDRARFFGARLFIDKPGLQEHHLRKWWKIARQQKSMKIAA